MLSHRALSLERPASYKKETSEDAVMNPYTYQKAASLADAVAMRQQSGSFLLAGGTDLIAQMKAGQRSASAIIDVKHVPELTSITEMVDGGLEIGAAVNATALANHDTIKSRHQALHDAAQLIGSLQIQNRATLGGNICNAAPSADAVPALIADRAEARIAGLSGERRMPLEELFQSPGRTTLAVDELLVSVCLPKPAARSASAYLRFTPRREMDIAVVGAGVRIDIGNDGMISDARVALASVAPTPVRAHSAEAALVGQAPETKAFKAAGLAAEGDATPISDTRGSADYRRDLIAVLVRRALDQCMVRVAHSS